jgi:L-arabinokinase
MTVDQDTTLRRSALAVAEAPIVSNGKPTEQSILSEALRRLTGEGARFAATAPFGLDVMGGFAEYSGALVLSVPLGTPVCAAAQRRQDGLLSICVSSRAPDVPFEVPIATLWPHGRAIEANEAPDLFRDERCAAAKTIVGILVEAYRAGALPAFPKGLSVSVGHGPELTADRCLAHALCAATLAAVAGALDCPVQRADAGAAYQRLMSEWLGAGPSRAEVLFALSAEKNCLNQLRTDTFELSGATPIPQGLEILGIDSGAMREDQHERYESVRAASFMGRLLVDKIIKYDKLDKIPWDGFLSRVSIKDYVKHFRHRLPTRLYGAEFLERFGETGDGFSRIDPDSIYRIRSRTEHHIYEHARACDFVECIARYDRKRDDAALRDAGELMHASHWSYGQRCGLSSNETDHLVKLLRQRGEPAGIYGAKLTGRGCGGIVAVLVKSGERAEAAVNRAMEDYANSTGNAPRLLRGSLSGSLLTGPRAV